MSIDLVAAAMWLSLEGNRKLVLMALCDRADGSTGKCFPSLREITFRASLSEKSAIGHLKGLEQLGYVRRGRRPNARLGQTTERWLNVQRILLEGRERKAECDALRWAGKTPEETTGNGNEHADQLKFEDESPEVDGRDHLKLAPESPEAASRPTVSAPRPMEQSDQPSERARGARPDVGDLGAFASRLNGRLHASVIAELAECFLDGDGARVVIYVADVALRGKLLKDPIASRLRMCAVEAGFDGYEARAPEAVPS